MDPVILWGMASIGDDRSLLLPENARLFYIGPPKTGTTSLQEAAKAARAELYELGVYYPGTGRNHRAAITSFMGQRDPLAKKVGGRAMAPGSKNAAAQRIEPKARWRKLMEDIESEPSKRVLISHEYAAGASDDEANRWVEELGTDRAHIVITLRPLWAVFVSRWIETLKSGISEPLSDWLERYYDPSDHSIDPRPLRYLDQGALVERWAAAAGPENVTVIVVDKSHQDILMSSFEQMLGLPDRTLTDAVSGGLRTNRSMSKPEAELIRELNEVAYQPDTTSWPLYLDVVKLGAVTRLLRSRTPGPSEPRVQLPHWAVERAVRDSNDIADRIAASGVRVVGDLDYLRSEPPARQDDEPVGEDVMHHIAVEALAGALDGAARYEQDVLKNAARPAKGGGKAGPARKSGPKTGAAPRATVNGRPVESPATRGTSVGRSPLEQSTVAKVASRDLLAIVADRGRRRVRQRLGRGR